MTRPKADSKSRLNLNIRQVERDRLESLAKRLEARSLTEVIGRALLLLESVCDAEDEGREMFFQGKDGIRERLRIL